jgi:hypothetical protein
MRRFIEGKVEPSAKYNKYKDSQEISRPTMR